MGIRHPHKVVVTSGATLVNAVIYPYPCTVHAIHVSHVAGAAGWIQLHNSATVPEEGAVPLYSHAVAANSDADIEGTGYPFYFSEGVYICESDTIPTKTLTTPTDLFVSMVIEVSDIPE
jgi:hypothetical protein